MIAARQEIDLRPQLERLDRLILCSEGLDPGALRFAFRPLWQLDAPTKAALALSKAQATAVYAGLGLWPAAVTARLVQAQLIEDGTYPNAAAVFAEAGDGASPTLDFDPDQPRDPDGRWTAGGGAPWSVQSPAGPRTTQAAAKPLGPGGILGFLGMLNPVGTAQAAGMEGEGENRPLAEILPDPMEPIRTARFTAAWRKLEEVDPTNRDLASLKRPGEGWTEADITRVEAATREAMIVRTCDFLWPNGQPVGQRGTSSSIRLMPGGPGGAQPAFDHLSRGGTVVPFEKGSMVQLPGGNGAITFRPETSTPGPPAIDINIPGLPRRKLHY